MRMSSLAGILFITTFFPCFLFASPEEEIESGIEVCKELAHKDLAEAPRDELVRSFLAADLACSQPEINSKLDAQEKRKIQDLRDRYKEFKKSCSKDYLEQLEKIEESFKPMLEEALGRARIYEGEELASLDAHLRSIWKKMVQALREKNVDQAVTYFARAKRESYRKIFLALKDRLPDVANEFGDIQLVRMRTARDVQYDIQIIREGQRLSFQLIFVKEADEWRILNY